MRGPDPRLDDSLADTHRSAKINTSETDPRNRRERRRAVARARRARRSLTPEERRDIEEMGR